MKQLRQSAARERRFPIIWWLFLMVLTGGMFLVAIYDQAPYAALLVGILLAAAWAAPLVALQSLIPPRRAPTLAPAPGEGTYKEWMKQARQLGRLLLYYEENRDMGPELRKTLQAARADLNDTLKAHPLRDDLERACERIRTGAVPAMKAWLWKDNGPRIQEVVRGYEHEVAEHPDEDDRLIALQTAVENAAARMTRYCLPRMLERERLLCARDCAWLASQTANGHGGRFSPIELAAALVIEWGDFSEPWQPARMLRRAVARLDQARAFVGAAAVSGAAPAPELPAANGHGPALHRVRVRVRRKRRHRHHRGPSFLDILLSFGQWVRYSIRSFMMYR